MAVMAGAYARAMPTGHPDPSDAGRRIRLSRLQLAAFTMPVLLFQAIEMGWRAYLPRFLNQDVGIALGLIGALMLGARLLDALADPLLGWLSDTQATRFGRRKPWMVAGALLVAAGAPLLFLAPPGASAVQIVGASLLLHIGYSFIITPHGGWGLELSDDPYQRTRIMGAKVWFALLGSLALLAGLAVLERLLALPLRDEMAALGCVLAVAAPLTVLAPVLMFKERPAHGAQAGGTVWHVLGGVLCNRALRPVLLLYMLAGLADAAAATSFLFLTADVLKLEGWGAMLLLIQPVMALLALPFWGRMSARLDRRLILKLAYGWQGLCLAALLLVPAGSLPLLATLLAVKGLAWGIDFMLLRAMVADAVDGEAGAAPMAASFYGVSSVALKIAMGLGSGGALWALAGVAEWTDPVTRDMAMRLICWMPGIIGAALALLILRGKAQGRSVLALA